MSSQVHHVWHVARVHMRTPRVDPHVYYVVLVHIMQLWVNRLVSHVVAPLPKVLRYVPRRVVAANIQSTIYARHAHWVNINLY